MFKRSIWSKTIPLVIQACTEETGCILTTYIQRGTQYYLLLEPRFCLQLYRVSIKSFPDYKHLLQENYVEYKLFFSKCNSTQEGFLQLT
jgi:hypothetical protein